VIWNLASHVEGRTNIEGAKCLCYINMTHKDSFITFNYHKYFRSEVLQYKNAKQSTGCKMAGLKRKWGKLPTE
jgi:hypothetical protein